MFSTWIDDIFGPTVQGSKTEITVALTGTLNLVNTWLGVWGIQIPTDVLSGVNTLLITLIGLFAASKMNNTLAAATVAATQPPISVSAPQTVIHGPASAGMPITPPSGDA